MTYHTYNRIPLCLKFFSLNLACLARKNYCLGCDPVRSKVEPGGGGGAAPRSRSGRRWETGLQRVCTDDALGFRRLRISRKNVHL